MNTSSVSQLPNLAVLARMLERVEHSGRPLDADQYRALVEHVTQAIESIPRDAAFDALLANFPASAEIYENLNYQHAGLCRSPLEPALAAEMAARRAIDAARQPRPASN